ncbi:hypothetical protein CU103_25530 [Phyllobacterium sophorae]|uniref:Uncharacterized protein n=1 Tax=Phyllobacterium sophorae TaxID=1520277 RepID=A0A2P7B381_9HYPH|nr:hypothetical protein CU103_25530 [Phyllobacterium sophorae]
MADRLSMIFVSGIVGSNSIATAGRAGQSDSNVIGVLHPNTSAGSRSLIVAQITRVASAIATKWRGLRSIICMRIIYC